MAAFQGSVEPLILHALVDHMANLLTEVEVSLGMPAGLFSGDFLAVGITDPDARRPASSSTSDYAWGTSVFSDGFDQTGEVAMAAVSVLGSDELTVAVDRVYGIFAQVVAYLRDSWSSSDLLGVPGLWDLRPASTELVTVQSDDGCIAYLLIRLGFQART